MASPGSGRLCSVSSMFESCVLRGTVVSGDTAAEASQLVRWSAALAGLGPLKDIE